MTRDVLSELRQGLPRDEPRNDYTRKAFQMLPQMDRPSILDVGCGRGGPTLELARLSQGRIVGIDIQQPALDELTQKAEQAGLSHRVLVKRCSMFSMEFPDASFDIIWSEGSIHVVGFERGLREWGRLIKPDGFLVVHDMAWLRPDPPKKIYDFWKSRYAGISNVPGILAVIGRCGYRVLGHFMLPEDFWWAEYYGPLQERVHGLRRECADDRQALELLDGEQREIDLFKEHCQWYGSAFFVMQKGAHTG
jgi:SAM-dependent methyltransferase